jgi:cytoskeletal protein RodZ
MDLNIEFRAETLISLEENSGPIKNPTITSRQQATNKPPTSLSC